MILNQPWCGKTHNADDKYYDEEWQQWLAKNQMSWFLKIVRPVKFLEERGENTSSTDTYL
jgi:hypothetical protein